LSTAKEAYLEEETTGLNYEYLLEWFYTRTCREEREDI